MTLPGRDAPFRGQIIQISPVHNVTLIKIDPTSDLPTVELFDSYETLRKGDQTTVMGYSDASPPVYGEIQTKDSTNPGLKIKMIAESKLHAGPVSDIIQDKDTRKGRTVSVMGDYIVLSLQPVGIGASGAPIFDSQGRVIGVFLRDNPNEPFGVPIRYGKGLGGS